MYDLEKVLNTGQDCELCKYELHLELYTFAYSYLMKTIQHYENFKNYKTRKKRMNLIPVPKPSGSLS